MAKDKYNYNLGVNVSEYDFKDKERCITNHINYMLARTQAMFEYDGLPDTVPKRSLELMLQTKGYACWTEVNSKLYVLWGGLGGEPNPYYMPTKCTVANPALNFSKMLTIDEDCVIMPSDSMYMGLLPMFRKYATLLTENEISLRLIDINSRIVSLISAKDDNTKESAIQYLEQVERGNLGVVGDSLLLDSIKAQPYTSSGSASMLTELIEFEQYLKGTWFNDIGLQANYNMKREAINEAEAGMNEGALLPFIDNMLQNRKEALEKVNAMFGTNISVKLSSTWEDFKESVELNKELLMSEIKEDTDVKETEGTEEDN